MNANNTIYDSPEKLLSKLDKVTSEGPNKWQACCPAHDDHNPSLSICINEYGKILLHCHAGCDYTSILSEVNLSSSDLNLKPLRSEYAKTVVAEYNYLDPTNRLLYQVLRYLPKTFKQRKPDGKGGWTWSIKDVPRVLYNLPALINANTSDWIFITEGEKDADNLIKLGLTATTNSGGAGKWKHISDVSVLHGRRIVIIPDQDSIGKQHAYEIAKALHNSAGEIRILDLGKESQFIGKDISDWIQWFNAAPPDKIVRELMKMVDSAPSYAPREWPELSIYDKHPLKTLTFPLDSLPLWLREMVTGIATSTQTPTSLVGSIALGVLAVACAGKTCIQVSADWSEPLNLYIAVAMNSGARKSSVFKKLTAPLERWEESQQHATTNKIIAINSKRELLQSNHNRLRKKYLKGDDTLEKEVLELSKKLQEMNMPTLRRILAADATPEAIVRLLDEQDGRLGVFSAEGGEVLSIMSGRYSRHGQSNIDVFLKAHAGDTIAVDRADRSRDAIIVRNPALTIALCMQVDLVKTAWQKTVFKSRGLLARFLWVIPENMMGTREISTEPISHKVKNEYEKNINNLLQIFWKDSISEIASLSLSDKAKTQLQKLREKLEPELLPTGEYKDMIGWASKYPGLVVRIAGLLHIASNTTNQDQIEIPVTEETMIAAIKLGEFFLSQVKNIHQEYGEANDERISNRILQKIKLDMLTTFSERDMYRSLGVTKAAIQESLTSLKDTNHIRKVQIAPTRSKEYGRKPSQEWEVNPHLLPSSVNSVNSVDRDYS